MRKLLRIVAYGALALVALPVVLYLALALANLGDDELAPAVRALLDERPAEIAPESNGYFAWIGVRGHPEQDPHAWGRRWLVEVIEAPPPGGAGGEAAYPIVREAPKPPLDSKDIPCDKIDACLEAVAADPAKARAALERAAPLLTRVERALDYPAYQEVWRLGDPARPLPMQPFQWRSLAATRFALAVHEGRHDAALAGLTREIAFLRRQLAGSTTLIGKLVAVSNLRVRYQVVGQYLRRHPQAALARQERIAGLLEALPATAVDFRPVMAAEERELLHAFRSTLGQLDRDPAGSFLDSALPNALARPLLRINQTLNELDADFAPWRDVDARTGDAYRRALAEIGAAQRARDAANEGVGALSWRNPIGRLLIAVGSADYRTYFRRRDDLLAQRALAAFQFDLLKAGTVAPDAIGDAIAARAGELIHAYHGKPPAWTAATRTVAYPAPTRDNGEPIRHEAPVSAVF